MFMKQKNNSQDNINGEGHEKQSQSGIQVNRDDFRYTNVTTSPTKNARKDVAKVRCVMDIPNGMLGLS